MTESVLLATRYSDHKQDGGTSTEIQVDACSQYCDRQNFNIIAHHEVEAESAKASNTARIIELINFCKKYQRKTKYLIVFKVNRFARDVASHYYLKTELLKMGIILRSATEPIDESPTGELMETILAGLAQFQNSVKREHVKLAMRRLLERGIWPWKTPLGFQNVKTKLNKADIAIVDGNCVHVVIEIFNRFSYGSISVAELSRELNRKTIYDYNHNRIRFSSQKLNKLLTNKFYIGIMEVKKWNEEFEGSHKSLIDEKTFYKCQLVLNENSYNLVKRKGVNPDFPLKDRLYCNICGKRMTAAWCKGKTKKYPLYYCKNPNCKNNEKKSIEKSDFEAEFYSYLDNVKPKGKDFEKFRERLLTRYEQRKSEFETNSDRVRQLLNTLVKEKQRLIDMGKSGVLDDDELKEELNKVRQQIRESKLEINESHEEEFKIELLLDYAEMFFRTLPDFWLEANTSAKTQLQRILFPKGIVYSYPGFSNSKLSPRFKLIEDIVTTDSTLVTPRGIEPRFTG